VVTVIPFNFSCDVLPFAQRTVVMVAIVVAKNSHARFIVQGETVPNSMRSIFSGLDQVCNELNGIFTILYGKLMPVKVKKSC